ENQGAAKALAIVKCLTSSFAAGSIAKGNVPGDHSMLLRLSILVLLLSSSCRSFGQLQFSLNDGLVLGCDVPVTPNATIDVGSIQVGSAAGVGFCLVKTGATPITVTGITLSTTRFRWVRKCIPNCCAAEFGLALVASRRSFKRVALFACFLVLGLLTSCG